MPKFDVVYSATVRASKNIVVEAVDEESAIKIADERIAGVYYDDPTRWELECPEDTDLYTINKIK